MAYLNKAEKRTFAADTIKSIRNNSELLAEQGYKPYTLISELEQLLHEAEVAEARQLRAKADLRDATIHAQKSLNSVYVKASAAINIVIGLLGKQHTLVRQLKKLRSW